jgi:predicted helicase
LPRIPFCKDFSSISRSGRELGLLHVNHITCAEYPLDVVGSDKNSDPHPRVTKIRWDVKGSSPRLLIAEGLSLTGFPKNYQDFTVNGRSPIDWAIDRYQVKTDSSSGIVNDPNTELLNLGGIVSTIKRLAFVSSESLRIIQAMPPIEVVK